MNNYHWIIDEFSAINPSGLAEQGAKGSGADAEGEHELNEDPEPFRFSNGEIQGAHRCILRLGKQFGFPYSEFADSVTAGLKLSR